MVYWGKQCWWWWSGSTGWLSTVTKIVVALVYSGVRDGTGVELVLGVVVDCDFSVGGGIMSGCFKQ